MRRVLGLGGSLERSRERHTNMPAITQFPVGTLSIPVCPGKVNMIYSSKMKPGASIVIHPIRPGILNFDSMDVLPMGYQVVIHCTAVNYISEVSYEQWINIRRWASGNLPKETTAISSRSTPNSLDSVGLNPVWWPYSIPNLLIKGVECKCGCYCIPHQLNSQLM